MKTKGAGFLLLLFFGGVLLAQNLINDPLLQKPWISDAEEEEKRSFYRFQAESKQKQKTVKKKDSFGRNYTISPSGKIQFLIDDEYYKEFPILTEADIATRELAALLIERKEKEAVFLGKGINLCYRLKQAIEPGFFPNWLSEANQKTNDAINLWSDENLPLDLVSDPYGCYLAEPKNKGDLVLESESFRYRLTVPHELKFEGLFGNRLGVYGENRDSVYRIVRFVQFLDSYLGPNETEWEEAMVLQEAGKIKKQRPKIILSVGSSFDKSPNLRNTKNYFQFWDLIRGLTEFRKRSGAFKREEVNKDYTSVWTELDETGNKVEMEMKEYYLYRSPRGFFLSISYPKREKEKALRYWDRVRPSFQVKE
ncbi:hypothetical protein P3G55_05840 [Leptospira sp. 96542]|nr:hypothetical protein [Leptospira sp. 96542]